MHFLKMDGITGLFRSVILVIALVVVSESRVVKVPNGPLVRVEGQAVSIRCDVFDYQGPRDQDFDWSIVLAGNKLLPLVSTFDDNFTDTTVKDRVNSGDISYKKLADNAVELRFKKVRATDSGLYRCSTPSTDSVISGNYDADVELKVIGDSLKVSSAIPKSAVSEGESVELQCNATQGFTEHTFLSVTWSIRKGSEPLEEILTFGPDHKIKVGSNYTQLYTDGGLRLDLHGGGFYGLVLKRAKPSDQGEYVCTGREWVRQGEGGRNWRKILEKSEDMGKVVVTPTVIGDSLKVSSAIPKSAVSEGESVELQCNATQGFTEHTFLSVTWSIRKGSGPLEEILTFGPDHKIEVGSNYTQLYTDGGLRLDLHGGGFYGLVLKRAKPSDQGEYVCTGREWVRQGEGGRNWRKILEKSEEMGKVVVTKRMRESKFCV